MRTPTEEEKMIKVDTQARIDELQTILLDFHKNQLAGKGFDFFFVLSTRLAEHLKN